MGLPKEATITIENTACPTDGCDAIVFMPLLIMDQYKESHYSFYCYRGHSMSFGGKSKTEKLKAQIEEKNRQIVSERKRTEWARQDLKKEKHSNRALKGVITKTKKRIANGVCPCCNRSGFKDLERHMSSKHPNWANSEP